MMKKNNKKYYSGKIKFCDLNRQYEVLRGQIDEKINKVLQHARFINGPEIKQLEDRLSSFLGVKHAIGVASGTDALFSSLLAIAIEPGKFLVGDAGVLLLRVEYIKKSYGNLFACVDGGTFNTVPRPAIYTQAQHHIVNCAHVEAKHLEKITVPGNLCETGDVFRKEIWMPTPRNGDILALLCAGAYCRSMASNFNLREIPKEVVV